MKDMKYVQALKRVVLAYVILLFNFNLGTFNIIPNWLAYLYFYKAIPPISKYEKSVSLLKPIIIVLGIYEFIEWILVIAGINIDIYVLKLIVTAVCLYFNFQLLTNITDISLKNNFKNAKYLYLLRNLKTILITLFALPINWQEIPILSILFIFFSFIFQILLCIILNQYANDEKNR